MTLKDSKETKKQTHKSISKFITILSHRHFNFIHSVLKENNQNIPTKSSDLVVGDII